LTRKDLRLLLVQKQGMGTNHRFVLRLVMLLEPLINLMAALGLAHTLENGDNKVLQFRLVSPLEWGHKA